MLIKAVEAFTLVDSKEEALVPAELNDQKATKKGNQRSQANGGIRSARRGCCLGNNQRNIVAEVLH